MAASDVPTHVLPAQGMDANLQGRLRNTALLPSNGMAPLYEAVSNSIHAIADAAPSAGRIRIQITRDTQIDLVDGHRVRRPVVELRRLRPTRALGVLRSPGAAGVNVLVRSASRTPAVGRTSGSTQRPVAAAPVPDRLEASVRGPATSSAAAGGATNPSPAS